MNVAILGATSQSTPGLFRSLANSVRLPEITFRLCARDGGRLAGVVRAAGILTDGQAQLESYDFSDTGLAAALDGADVVLIQIRFGGLDGREYDEGFPLAFGACGDEGLGAGGLSAAWRSWPVLSSLLDRIRASCAGAAIFLLTSPGNLLTRLASVGHQSLNVRGFCELPWTTLKSASPHDFNTYDYLGINHVGWIYGLPGKGPIASKYWRLATEREAVLREQKTRPESRAAELKRLAAAALASYGDGDRAQINAALDARSAPWYSDAFAPLLESLFERHSRTHFFFTIPNRGWSDDFLEDDILEIPHVWAAGELIRRPPRRRPDPALVATLRPFVEYERAAATAVINRDLAAIEVALGRHPWTLNRAQARNLTNGIAAQSLLAEAGGWKI